MNFLYKMSYIKNKFFGILFIAIFAGGIFMSCSSYHHAYQPTASSVFEEKLLPEAYVLETKADKSYEDSANNMFRRLFNYINKNEIKMTVPVEADIETQKSAMRFYLSPEITPEGLKSDENVEIRKMPPKLVISHGARGSYSYSNVYKAKTRLEEWLQKHSEYSQKGEIYAIFWDSPFKLWFLKRFEVHAPVEKIENKKQ